MKSIRAIILGISLTAYTVSPVFGVLEDAGTNSPFELGAGARALSLAGAFVAVADDATAILWNPGGLAQLDQIEVTAMHIPMFFDTPYDFFGIAYPVLDWGIFSLGAIRVATEGVLLRDERSRIIGSGEGSLDLREYMIAYSRDLYWNIRAGIVFKIDQQRLLGDFDTGVGMDLGLHYQFPKDTMGVSGFDWENLRAGITFQNLLGSQLRLGEVTDVLPLNFKFGLAYAYHTRDSLQQRIIITGAWEKSTWREFQIAVGLEYSLLGLLAIRGGINSSAWTAGGGVNYMGISFDYALAGEELGLTHRFSLSYKFGPNLSEQRAERERERQEKMDREVQERAKAEMEKTRQDMDRAMRTAERRHRREKQDLLAKQQQLLDAERKQRSAAVADEYFKAYHYFQGIKDYMAKNYPRALVEFETVARYDPNYLELQLYLQRTRQRIEGKVEFRSEKSYALYYKGIDLYLEHEFAQAIETWKKIFELEPNNVLVLRNIEEAEERIAKLKAVQKIIDEEEKRQAPGDSQPEAAPRQPETEP